MAIQEDKWGTGGEVAAAARVPAAERQPERREREGESGTAGGEREAKAEVGQMVADNEAVEVVEVVWGRRWWGGGGVFRQAEGSAGQEALDGKGGRQEWVRQEWGRQGGSSAEPPEEEKIK